MNAEFDTDKFYLGSLCKRGHDYNDTGDSLRHIKTNRCVECGRIYKKKWYQNNKDKIKEYVRQYNEQNKKMIRIRYLGYIKNQRKINSQFAVRERIRISVYKAIKKHSQNKESQRCKGMGIDIDAIIAHLGPHPNTLGIKGDWHIDHIIPLALFDLNDPEQIKLAFAPENHRFLKAKDNIRKSNKIEGQLNIQTQDQLGAVLNAAN